MKKPTFAAVKKALTAVEIDFSGYDRESCAFVVFLADWDAREREEIAHAQAIKWLELNGYDVKFVRRHICGNYRGIEWNAVPYGAGRELAFANID